MWHLKLVSSVNEQAHRRIDSTSAFGIFNLLTQDTVNTEQRADWIQKKQFSSQHRAKTISFWPSRDLFSFSTSNTNSTNLVSTWHRTVAGDQVLPCFKFQLDSSLSLWLVHNSTRQSVEFGSFWSFCLKVEHCDNNEAQRKKRTHA